MMSSQVESCRCHPLVHCMCATGAWSSVALVDAWRGEMVPLWMHDIGIPKHAWGRHGVRLCEVL